MILKDFLQELSSSKATPGGGSAAALSGALGAALISMACNLTIGKEAYKEVEKEIQTALDKSQGLLSEFIQLIDLDSQAFGEYMQTIKMPKNNEEEKQKRTESMQKAIKNSAEVPLQIAEASYQTIVLAEQIVDISNKKLISDVGVAVETALAGLESAVMNININLPSIKDQNYIDEMNIKIANLLEKGRNSKDKTSEIVRKALA